MAPSSIHFEIWDRDIISSDSFIGSFGGLELNLQRIPAGTRSPKTCTLDILKSETTISLFETKSVRGWYPFTAMDEFDMSVIAGKAELEFTLVNFEEAEKNPVGKAREEPDSMIAPVRPDNSLAWLFFPITMLIHLIWIPYKDCFLRFFVMILMVAILVLVIYTLPSSITGKIV
ncbi:hypothetical protein HZS_5169 [Henneguya salminicola]|nr:hypothetical protein HZS_5169 [Henneguya salminicola]